MKDRGMTGGPGALLDIHGSSRGARFKVRVKPGARETAISGTRSGALLLSVSAPPERGKANEEVRRLLGSRLGLGRAAVQIVVGLGTRDKLVEVEGLTPDDVLARLRG